MTYELTSDVSEVNVLRRIKTIEGQALDPNSPLKDGDVTHSVVRAGELEHEIELHACSPVYLGPDVGFVDVFSMSADGDCLLNVAELEEVCSAYCPRRPGAVKRP